jgi:DNA repair exonuclease SbcCD ATPase subunit
MSPVLDLLNLVGLGGVALFLYYLYRGLRERIKALAELAEEQHKTLEAVRTRAEEMDRLSGAYKQAVSDFQEIGEKLDLRRKELIQELEAANERKDSELAKLADLQLQEVELKKKSLERLPELEKNLENAVKALGRQVRILVPSSETQLSLWSRSETLLRSCDYYYPASLREQTPASLALNNYLYRVLAAHLGPEPNEPEGSAPTKGPNQNSKETEDGEEERAESSPKVST